MLRRDYIMKLIQQLMDAIFLLLNDNSLGEEEKKKKITQFYKDFMGEEREFYYANDFKSILTFIEAKYGDELIERIEMLSEIMYQDIIDTNFDTREQQLQKLLQLLDHLDTYGNTYSLVREGKKERTKSELLKYTNLY